MSDLITYDDKIRLKSQNVSDKYKVTAEDMNEIKEVVNNNATEGVSVGAEAPVDGRRVWFEKGKNLFDGQLELGMYDATGAKATNNANYRNVAPINVQPSTTYTFSINGTSQKYVVYFYKKDGTFISANASLTSGTFTTPAETYLLNFRCFNADFVSDYANLKIQLEPGSSASAFESFVEKSIKVDNENFISMSDLVSVGVNQPSDGKRVWLKKGNNMFDNALIIANLIKARTTITYENEQIVMRTTGADAYFGNIVSVGNSWSEQYGQLISVEPNTNYTLSITNNVVDKNLITYYDENKVSIKIDYSQPYQVTFMTPNNAKYVSFRFGTANSTSDGVYKFNITLKKGSDKSYEPYVEEGIYVDKKEWYSKPKALYVNTTGIAGSSSGTQITLNDNINNYSKIEVTLGVSKAECDTYILPIWESAKTVSVFLEGLTYYFRFRIEASNNTLTFTEISIVGWSDGTSKLFRVVGYK